MADVKRKRQEKTNSFRETKKLVVLGKTRKRGNEKKGVTGREGRKIIGCEDGFYGYDGKK